MSKKVKPMLVEVRAIDIQGLAIVVSFRDEDGMLQARIISHDEVPGLRIGQTELVSSEFLVSGTDYGIDWEILLGDDGVITPLDLQQEFRRRGLWTYKDINENSPQVMASLNSLSNRLYANMIKEAREIKLER